MTSILIKNGHVIDPTNKIDKKADVLIQDGVIVKVGKADKVENTQIIDAKGKVVTPGIFDMHVHLRDPGREDKETIETGMRAALNGGITSVLSMPNTIPIADDQTVVGYQYKKAEELNLANLYVAGRITTKDGKIAQMRDLKAAGAIAVTDDGKDVDDGGLLLHAMEWARTFDLPVITHAEYESLSKDGVMHEGKVAQLLGLEGQPRSAEVLSIYKSILLAEESGVQLHVQHISTAAGVDAIRQAKKRGVHVTAEATPHHIALTEEACLEWNTDAKVNPPLREESDRQAIIEGVKDGTIDVIATDHAPHLVSEKLLPFKIAPVGLVGLETCFAVINTYLVKSGAISMASAIEKMTIAPSRILGVPRGTLSVGAVADVSIFDTEVEWMVNPAEFESKGRNTPFEGMKLNGKATHAIVGGSLKMQDGTIL